MPWFAGRMHAACISSIDTSKKLVSVEWTESNTTKGKEVLYIHIFTCKCDYCLHHYKVDFDQLFILNPQLLEPQSHEVDPKKKETPTPSAILKVRCFVDT